ncbi:MAG: imidazole glycerol phosphate synthase subunit HisH [Candidatus Omnitrophota bacterium]
MITIIDYGMGNLRSVEKAFELFTKDVRISSSPQDILASDKIVLPGVGAFNKAIEELRKRDLVKPIQKLIGSSVPFLGICLGLQLLFTESEEGGRVSGLDILKGKVKLFKDLNGLKIPHMGWNQIEVSDKKNSILKNIEDKSFMYFVHSYYVEPEDKDVILCSTDYGMRFTSGIAKDNLFAFQFHPEKSQSIGLNIIKNFVGI